MIIPPLYSGRVIRYSYLWYEEKALGHEEGESRPCVILQTFPEGAETRVVVIPITHSLQSKFESIEIPYKVARHLNLDEERMWAVCSNANEFYWSGPDLRPIPKIKPVTADYGQMPQGLFAPIRDRFMLISKGRQFQLVTRT